MFLIIYLDCLSLFFLENAYVVSYFILFEVYRG